jgi:cytochrome P450
MDFVNMPFNTRFYQHMLQARRAEYNKSIQDFWTANGPDVHSADMVVIAGDITVRAHSSVLRHKSSYFGNALAATISGPVGAEINIHGVDVSTFWMV